VNNLGKIAGIFSADVLIKIIIGLLNLSLIPIFSDSDYVNYLIVLTSTNLLSGLCLTVVNRVYIIGDNSKTEYTFNHLLCYQVTVCVFISLFLYLYTDFFNGYLLFIIILSLLKINQGTIQTCYQKELKFKKYYLVEYVRVIIYLITFIALYTNDSLNLDNWIYVNLISYSITASIFTSRIFKFKEFVDFNYLLKLIKSTILENYKYLYGYWALLMIFSYADIYVLKLFSNKVELAGYGVAFSLYMFILLSVNAVNKFYLPLINKIECKEEVRKIFREHIKFVSLIFPIYLVGICSIDYIVPELTRGRYLESINILKVLATSAYFSLFLSPYASLLLKLKCFKFQFYLVFVAILIYIILVLVFKEVINGLYLSVITSTVYLFINISTCLYSRKIFK